MASRQLQLLVMSLHSTAAGHRREGGLQCHSAWDRCARRDKSTNGFRCQDHQFPDLCDEAVIALNNFLE